MPHHRPDISLIVKDNETVATQMLDKGNYVGAYLPVHALVEALLRLLLREYDVKKSFSHLIDQYNRLFLKSRDYSKPTFVKELMEFNKRRNRIVHGLWQKGFSLTNKQAETAARGAIITYGLFSNGSKYSILRLLSLGSDTTVEASKGIIQICYYH